MDGFSLSRCCQHLFGFEVNRLPDFVVASRLQASVAGDMGRDLQFLPICIGLNTGIQLAECPMRLNVESSCEKERS